MNKYLAPGDCAPQAQALLRILTSANFITHGLIRIFGFPPGAAPGPQPLASLFGVAGVMELVGGILVLFGFLTRPVAFLLSGEMATLYCFIFLFFAAAGPGAWAIDNRRNPIVPPI